MRIFVYAASLGNDDVFVPVNRVCDRLIQKVNRERGKILEVRDESSKIQ